MKRILAILVGASLLACAGPAGRTADVASPAPVEGGLRPDGLIEHRQGPATATIGKGTPLPADWPSELTPPASAVPWGVVRSDSPVVAGKSDFFAVFDQTNDCPAAMAYFRERLAGWTIAPEGAAGPSMSLTASSPDRSVQVSIGCTKPEDAGTTMVSWSNTPVPRAG